MEIQKFFSEYIQQLNKLNLKDNDLYVQYASMKNAVKVLEERIEELNGMIKEEMEKTLGVEKQKFPFGTFTIGKKSVYKFSENIKKLEEEFKTKVDELKKPIEEEKQKEIEEGIAIEEIKTNLIFR